MSFEENKGINRLARVLSHRMKKESASPLVLDFGQIAENGSLLANTFPVPVPKGDYAICRHLAELGGLSPGDRVLMAWVQNEAVVIDRITGS